MAKLTARFELEDRISRKLMVIRTEAEKLERSRQRLNKPLSLTVRDRATNVLRGVKRFIDHDIAKTHQMAISIRDKASRPLNDISTRLRTRFPRSHEIIVNARDRATPVLNRLRTFLASNIIGTQMMFIHAKDRATPVINRIVTYTNAVLAGGFSFTIRAVDLASRTAMGIGNFINNNIPRLVTTTVKVVDLATKPLQMISNTLSSTLGLLGVAGGVGGGFVVPIKLVADREDITTQFEIMLGSRENALKRLDELTAFAGRTPLTRDEIYRSSRILQVFTGDALSTAEGLQLIGDVAVATQTPLEDTAIWFGRLYDGIKSGRPIGDATSRLQEMGAISGEARARIEKLAQSGESIEKLWPKVAKEFEGFNGMMEKMSHNMNNLLLGLRSFISNTILIPWGEGLRDGLRPALLDFRAWRSDYSFVLSDMSSQLRSWGNSLMENILRPTRGVFGFIGEQMKILFPGTMTEELELKMKEDPELRKRFEALEKYRNMPLEVRWRLVKENVGDEIEKWWNTTGKQTAEKVGTNIGRAYGGFIRSALLTILGTEAEETGNPFVDSGILAGKSFISGFIEALNPIDLTQRVADKLKDINVGGFRSLWGYVTGNEELKNEGSIAGALIADALVLAFIARFGRIVGEIGKVLKKGGSIAGKAIGTFTPKTTRTTKSPVHRQPLFNRGERADTSKSSRFGRFGRFVNRIPFIGPALGALAIGTASAEDRPQVIGSVAGGLTGALTGATIGSAIPIVGTTIGGVIGGIAGAYGGEKVVSFFQDNMEKIKASAVEAGNWIASSLSTAQDWVVEKFNSTQEAIKLGWTSTKDYVSEKWATLSNWFDDTVWKPIKNNAIDAINFAVGLFDFGRELVSESWATFSSWFDETVWQPIKQGAGFVYLWISDKFSQAYDFTIEKWQSFSTWFEESIWTPVKIGAEIAGNWISEKYNQAYTFVTETWTAFSAWFEESVWTPVKQGAELAGTWISQKYSESKERVKEAWGVVSSWFDNTVWSPIKHGAEIAGNWIGDKFTDSVDRIKGAFSGLSDWFSKNVWEPIKTNAQKASDWIKDRWNEAKSWASGIRERGERLTGLRPDRNATGGFITKPTLSWVGEAGREFIIPVDNHVGRGKMLLQQAANALGMNVIDGYDTSKLDQESMQVIKASTNNKTIVQKPSIDVQLNFTGDNHFSNEMDAEQVAQIAIESIKEYLEEGLNTESEGVYAL